MSDIENNTGLDVMMESDNEEANDKQLDENIDNSNDDIVNDESKENDDSKENEDKFETEEKQAEDDDDENAEPAGLDLGDVMDQSANVSADTSGNWIKIQNLMRPFTPQGLRKKITDLGGEISDPKTDFWLNSIKSMAFVKLSNHSDVHSKIVEELDGKTWPESSIKQLTLSVVDQTQKDNDVLVDQGGVVAAAPTRPAVDHRANYERIQKKIQERSRSRSPVKRVERQRSPTPKKDDTPRQMNTDDLDKLFKKTTAKPHIYWKPKKELATNE